MILTKEHQMNYKVSIIIPTYKRSDYLIRAIDSVINQTYSNIEVIVIDDNDPYSEFRKATEIKMQKYFNNKKVKYLKNEKNLGGALTRNIGIREATGDYITFLDDDDIYLPKKINTQLNYMFENDYDLTFTDVRIHDMEDRLIDYREHNYIKNFNQEELLINHLMHHLTPTGTYMFKQESIIKIGGFDNVSVGQEFILMLKAIECGLKIGYIPVAHVIQYVHNGERISTGQNKLDKEIELYNFKKRYFDRLTYEQKRYIKFRHHAVMAVAAKRSGNIMTSVYNLLLTLCVSPKYSLNELFLHINKIRKNRKVKYN